jgi:hypothetical protein
MPGVRDFNGADAKKLQNNPSRNSFLENKRGPFSFAGPHARLESVKQLTREQVEGRKEKAVRFTRDVLGDPERSAEIADESLESYADRKGFQIINPRGGRCRMPTKEELQDRIAELEQENEDLQAQIDDVLDILNPPEDENGDESDNGWDDDD